MGSYRGLPEVVFATSGNPQKLSVRETHLKPGTKSMRVSQSQITEFVLRINYLVGYLK